MHFKMLRTWNVANDQLHGTDFKTHCRLKNIHENI